MAKLVAYVGYDEVLVCSKKDEAQFLFEYFEPAQHTGRDIEDYDRVESTKESRFFQVSTSFHAYFAQEIE